MCLCECVVNSNGHNVLSKQDLNVDIKAFLLTKYVSLILALCKKLILKCYEFTLFVYKVSKLCGVI